MNHSNNVELVVPHSSLLSEGPVWDSQHETIYWIDILQGIIHQYKPDNQEYKSTKLEQMIGAMAICHDGKWIAALQKGIGFIEPKTGELEMIITPEAHLPNNRFNDGKCDPAGRFWAGTMSLSEEAHAGNLYALESHLSIEKKMEGVTISNGLAWSLDNQTLYYIDTPTFEVVAFNYALETGEIWHKRTVLQIPEDDGFPDGMTIDAEGMLWIAHWGGWQITRWNPVSGKKLTSIKLPVERVTSCTFGGKNLDDLYITTAKVGLSETQLAQQPLAGSLFVVKHCGFCGIEANLFKPN